MSSGRLSTPNSIVFAEEPPKGSKNVKGKKRKGCISPIRESPEKLLDRRVTRSQVSVTSHEQVKKRARINQIASKLAADEDEAGGDTSDASSKVESRVAFADLQPVRRKSRALVKRKERRSSPEPSKSPPRSRLSSPEPNPRTMAKPKKKKTVQKKSSTFLPSSSDGKEKRRNNGWQRVGPQFHSQADFEDSKEFRELRYNLQNRR